MKSLKNYYNNGVYIILNLLILLLSCNNLWQEGKIKERRADKKLVRQESFDTILDDKVVQLFTLRNSSGCIAQFTNYGARWVSMWIPDRSGQMTDVVLGFNTLKGYLYAEEQYHGAIVGRVCGRIGKARFLLDGKEYLLANNDLFGTPVKNHLHGGIKGFHRQIWNSKQFKNINDEQGIIFTYLSKNGEEGYPGNLEVKVVYLLTKNNELIIEYQATTDKPTPVNLTNHAYFNLNGEGNGDILNQMIKIYADKYVECDHELIPTGKLKLVKNTPLDFRRYATMGQNINKEHNEIFKGKGYAATMVVKEKNNESLNKVAIAFAKESGIKIELYSNKPCLQIYNAWLFNGKDVGKSGKPYIFAGGFILEPQGFPDAPNHENFPSIILYPGEIYNYKDIYKFSIKK